MSIVVTITCEATSADSMCPEHERVTAAEIKTLMDHPDASPRMGELDAARHIVASIGWRTMSDPVTRRLTDRCPAHSGIAPRRRRLTP